MQHSQPLVFIFLRQRVLRRVMLDTEQARKDLLALLDPPQHACYDSNSRSTTASRYRDLSDAECLFYGIRRPMTPLTKPASLAQLMDPTHENGRPNLMPPHASRRSMHELRDLVISSTHNKSSVALIYPKDRAKLQAIPESMRSERAVFRLSSSTSSLAIKLISIRAPPLTIHHTTDQEKHWSVLDIESQAPILLARRSADTIRSVRFFFFF